MAKLFKFSETIFCKVWILMCSPLSPSSPLGQRVTHSPAAVRSEILLTLLAAKGQSDQQDRQEQSHG